MKLETSKTNAMIVITFSILISSIWILAITDEKPKKLEVKVKPEDLSDWRVNVYGEIIGLVEQ